MWLAKFETKDGTDRVAVKNVRVYTYATAADDGSRAAPAHQAHEGLDRRPRSGTSRRHGLRRHQQQTAGTQPARRRRAAFPATAFQLTWYWGALRPPR